MKEHRKISLLLVGLFPFLGKGKKTFFLQTGEQKGGEGSRIFTAFLWLGRSAVHSPAVLGGFYDEISLKGGRGGGGGFSYSPPN